jgi:hypothetical protein
LTVVDVGWAGWHWPVSPGQATCGAAVVVGDEAPCPQTFVPFDVVRHDHPGGRDGDAVVVGAGGAVAARAVTVGGGAIGEAVGPVGTGEAVIATGADRVVGATVVVGSEAGTMTTLAGLASVGRAPNRWAVASPKRAPTTRPTVTATAYLRIESKRVIGVLLGVAEDYTAVDDLRSSISGVPSAAG